MIPIALLHHNVRTRSQRLAAPISESCPYLASATRPVCPRWQERLQPGQRQKSVKPPPHPIHPTPMTTTRSQAGAIRVSHPPRVPPPCTAGARRTRELPKRLRPDRVSLGTCHPRIRSIAKSMAQALHPQVVSQMLQKTNKMRAVRSNRNGRLMSTRRRLQSASELSKSSQTLQEAVATTQTMRLSLTKCRRGALTS